MIDANGSMTTDEPGADKHHDPLILESPGSGRGRLGTFLNIPNGSWPRFPPFPFETHFDFHTIRDTMN